MSAFQVGGMTCGGCAQAVKTAIGRVAPGSSVEVDLERARVEIEPDIDTMTLAKAVEAAGFEYLGLAAD